MFARLLHLLERGPRRLLWTVGLLALVCLAGGGAQMTSMTMGVDDYDDAESAAVRVLEDVEQATGANLEQGYVVLVELDEPVDPASAQRPERLERAVELIESRPEVAEVMDFASAQNPAMVREDGRSTYFVATVGGFEPGDAVTKAVTATQDAIEADEALADSITLGGPTTSNVEASAISSEDLGMAEAVAFPILLILLLFIFRGVIAALIPLGGALVSIAIALGTLGAVMTVVDLSVFALNLVMALGIGLSIDFSLLIISRFREELRGGHGTQEALGRTLRTAGRTVLYSGLTVAVALASLLVFPQRFLYTMGVAGIATSLGALLFALVGLPALLAVLGGRINKWAPKSWQRSQEQGAANASGGRWYRFSHGVMRRPISAAFGAGAVLVVMALPVLGINFTGIDSASMPEDSDAGRVYATLEQDFPGSLQSPVHLISEAPQDAGERLTGYGEELARLDGVAAVTPPRALGEGLWETQVALEDAPLSLEAQDTLEAIKGVDAPFPTVPTGNTALYDAMMASLGDHLPLSIALMSITTLLILFAMTGSVVLPLKAVVTNLLTLASTFGLLIFVFQDGHLEGLFDFTSQGALQPTMLIILLAVALAMSTDYTVFLFSRIKEGVDSGLPDREAIASGLEKVGRTVTLAAVLFCIPMGALVLSRLIFIKQLGFGTAASVIIDATLVRALLVPSLMALFGKANWWAPGPLRRFHERFLSGLQERDEPAAPAAGPTEDGREPAAAGQGTGR
ncbi:MULTISPECIES: MMPL family transporter [unclassified Streptomyces]|uniref:MMPL family transporter n=1 Tax=unclassified Streptomyces TaxID=2593676 RepID=UPI0022B5F8C9|nr:MULTISPECIES: MMPL family transporter [unclassified Streptomyces]MCZ7417814.1 MMPL family transporter [Streptomyces sp. WMMC897]MCZ7432381.1 MMPL family transporter [Streptomyces sp. WMMC1477]